MTYQLGKYFLIECVRKLTSTGYEPHAGTTAAHALLLSIFRMKFMPTVTGDHIQYYLICFINHNIM